MSGAAARAALAAVGRDLGTAASGRRAAAWLSPPRDAAPGGFAMLSLAPGWLRSGRDAQRGLAQAAAVFALAPALAASIDGAWLGSIARLAGEVALDRALAVGADTPGGGAGEVPADALEALGFDLMRAALPEELRSYLNWAPTRGDVPPSALALHALDHALALPADTARDTAADAPETRDMAA